MVDEGDEYPVVFCHGLFGWGDSALGGYPYFVTVERLTREGRIPRPILASTGPISSLHDQACELFYQLKGGRVNYGREHAERFGHLRYGREHAGFCPGWCADRPLDFVAHSMGAPVVRMLQHLLANRFFDREDGVSYGTTASWVRSITAVSGVHNGSTLAWAAGASEESGLLEPGARVVPFLVRLAARFARAQVRDPDLAALYDLKLDQWGIESLASAVDSLRGAFGLPRFAETADWALYDLTPTAMERWNKALVEYPDTWYFSHPTRATAPFLRFEIPVPFACRTFLAPLAVRMGRFVPRTEAGRGLLGPLRAWRPNDGMCPTLSQTRPFLGRGVGSARSRHGRPRYEQFPAAATEQIPERGRWIVHRPRFPVDHAELAMLPRVLRRGADERFFIEVYDRIRRVRAASKK